MRLLFVTTFYYPNMQGGVEQVVKRLAESLVCEENCIAIYCVDSSENETRIDYYNGIKIYRCSAHDFHLFKFSYDKKNIGKIEKLHQKLLCYYNRKVKNDFLTVCDEFRPDIIHTHTLYGIVPAIWKCAYKLNIPVVHTIHDLAPVSPVQYGHKASVLIRTFHKMYMNYYSSYVQAVTAPSCYTLETSLKAGCFANANITEEISNAIDIDLEYLKKLIAEKKRRESNIIKFVFAGRLVYFKGIKSLINAFLHADLQAELHICGSGELSQFVTTCAERDSRIIYHGKLNNEELYKVYQEADVMIVPSEWPEPFGMVVIEGNANALPVIASNCGGIPEIMDRIEGGILYEPSNENELIEAFTRFSNRKEYSIYFDTILKNINFYELGKQINDFKTLYQSLMER
ncbi:glycosyltransferase family 4 protein [Faecalicatena contorta]|uniref:Glycosyltransferase involved in cell wall bisynthesis n=1 Tax=Faecalicatena contorta TaxID=39482 RepID=A0A316A1X2_9FIRM|nr:glycosyltransferase family 4 protein [Faecalicatena contorta]PWJ51559.1 glycosyltransferase involved in cell wall biosynthesis [Faecalicatena contorta]SUQ13115.1 Glycosyltransferase involved in cell wall bisynthesis [Faecalicatena contorta]